MSVLLLIGALSCQHSVTQEGVSPTNGITIGEARTWFEETINSSGARKDEDKFWFRSALWESAYTHKFSDQFSVVVVPLNHVKKDRGPGFKEAWIYKTEDGQNQLRVVEYIEPVELKIKGVQRNIRTNFTGVMAFRDWDDNFIGGLLVKNHEIVAHLNEENGKSKKKSANGRPNGWYCGTSTTYWFFRVDTSNWPGGGVGPLQYGGSSTGSSCYWIDDLGLGASQAPTLNPGGGNYVAPVTIPIAYDPATWVFRRTQCDGYNQAIGLSRYYTREVHGLIMQDNSVLILPIGNNSWGQSVWSNVYENVNMGGITRSLYIDLNNKTVTMKYADGTFAGTLDIYATFHTHPCPISANPPAGSPTIGGATIPSDADKEFARSYPNVNHQIWNCGQNATYNQNGVNFSIPGSYCSL